MTKHERIKRINTDEISRRELIKYVDEAEATEKRLEELEKKQTPMKPIIEDEQPYCPICKTDLYYGQGIMNKYTDSYCNKCGQKLDFGDDEK